MTCEQLDNIIATLRQAQRRPGMFFPCTIDGFDGFLAGLHIISHKVLDMPFDEALTAAALHDRGWDARNAAGPLQELQARNMSVTDIISEVLDFEIDVLERLRIKLFRT